MNLGFDRIAGLQVIETKHATKQRWVPPADPFIEWTPEDESVWGAYVGHYVTEKAAFRDR